MDSELENLRAALRAIIDMNEGKRVCAYSWGQEYYKRCFDIAAAALGEAEPDETRPRKEWPSVIDGAETPFADNH